ncbi:MAG: C69 family dipeptidase [Bacteroides sp.]|jgi:dipeptidase|nr:C69 family dipeptidase [Bacteroides sp.]
MKNNFFAKFLFIALFLLFTPKFFFGIFDPEIDPDGPGYPESCTSIMVGRKASVDGSVMTAHSCDGNYRTWLEIVPSQQYEPGTMLPIRWGTLHTETAWDMKDVTIKGEIPQVEETFAYLNVAYPALNEKQLAIGETTFNGRRELRNEEGLFLIEELEKIALQRCDNAREAIRLMGTLAEEYGYGDWGECITVADTREVWQMEICGSGPGKPSAMWVAQRIPDDHVGISANIPRISDVDFDDPDYFMYSKDLKEVAKRTGFWDGEEPFKFWKVINGRKPFAIRDFYVLSTMAPSLNLSFEAEELPFSVKPDRKVSVEDVMAYYRETYEGTPYDMTQNLLVTVTRRDDEGNETQEVVKSPIANPWMNYDMRTLINELKPETIERQRTIAIAGCSYSHVIQCRDWLPDEIGAIAWFSFDNPGQSPRIPIFSGTLHLPESFKICGQHRYRQDAAIWSFREANRLANVNHSRGRAILEPSVAHFQQKAMEELPEVERTAEKMIKAGKVDEAREYITAYTNDFATLTMKRWEEHRNELWHMFGRGF